MSGSHVEIKETRVLPRAGVLRLYQANGWSSAEKLDELMNGLAHSHALVTAWDDERLVGLANAISDGSLVVYYPHALVLPDYQGRGIGRAMMQRLQGKYSRFHQQVLLADKNAAGFYEKCGFRPAGETEPMWIYAETDH